MNMHIKILSKTSLFIYFIYQLGLSVNTEHFRPL